MITELVDLSKERVYLSFPAYDGTIQVESAFSLVKAYEMLRDYGCAQVVYGGVKGNSLVTKARNSIVSKFMDTDCSILVMIDDDIIFPPEDLVRLIWWAGSGKDVVAGFYRQKTAVTQYRADLVNLNDRPVFGENYRLLEVERIGTGFMAIRRPVLKYLMDMNPGLRYTDKDENPAYALFDTKLEGGKYIGEDYAFCDLARKYGFKVWGDPYCHLVHVGSMEFGGSLSDGFNNAVESERRDETHEDGSLRQAA